MSEKVMGQNKRGKIIVIVAPSGTGKSTLIKKLKGDFPQLEESVSYTTRPQRKGEKSGEHYFFVTEDEFLKKRDAGEFLEWAKVHSCYYGTSKGFVEQGLQQGKYLLFDLDVQGCDSMKKHFNDEAQVIFIEPPSVEVLRERLYSRATDKPEVIKERVQNAEKELKRKNDFDHLVMNDDFEKCYQKLKDIVQKIIEE